MVATKLYVGNLPEDADKEELEQLFRKYGNVVEFDILKDYGFVHFEKEAEAKAAADALDGQVHHGNNIRVEISRSKVRQKAGMGGKGECYRCGGEGHWSKECPRGPSRSNRGRGGHVGDGFSPYDREPYYPDPYEYYARARMLPPHPYERYRFDPYERRLPPPPPVAREPLYRDFGRHSPDYYRRSSPPRDPYYDYYERRRLAAMDTYGDKLIGSGGPADDLKPMVRPPMQGRVPGPY
ncbi:RNA-binding protein 4B-like isoform X2 [Physella acuta]|uniref:RNA-binding protein 4B-like isoform X2 n=1 Tax=Physella acuta TaxID=109671 RepID=UPI0027DB7D30|nr:RNA-binding protein 4B-like isoform X2 [Physella acuta]